MPSFAATMPGHCEAACRPYGSEGDRIVCPACGRVWKVRRDRWVHPRFLYRWLVEWWWLA
jgi:hypothetical protein